MDPNIHAIPFLRVWKATESAQRAESRLSRILRGWSDIQTVRTSEDALRILEKEFFWLKKKK